jgi:precorrin-8X/cobalt-precorrin-8 methylmutase
MWDMGLSRARGVVDAHDSGRSSSADMRTRALFDAYLMVDWSASSRPRSGPDSVWIGIATRVGEEVRLEPPCNPRTRADAAARLRDRLLELTAKALRALVGFDFPYGYPRGFAAALEPTAGVAPWRATWDLLRASIRDDERNANNRFEVAAELNARLGRAPGPFWGCPVSRRKGSLHSRSCTFPYLTPAGVALERLRLAETCLRGVQETWKLYGNGSVGSQALTGIPRVAALRDDPALSRHSSVWPFETGLTDRPVPARGPFVLHAEIWPNVVPIDWSLHPVRDAAQVLALARQLARLDARGELGPLFRVTGRRDRGPLSARLAEEGWILGARAAELPALARVQLRR